MLICSKRQHDTYRNCKSQTTPRLQIAAGGTSSWGEPFIHLPDQPHPTASAWLHRSYSVRAERYDGDIMMSRTHITLDAEIQRKARQRASDLGISLAEYLRRLVARDLGGSQP